MSETDSNQHLKDLAGSAQAATAQAAEPEGSSDLVFLRSGGRWFGVEADSVREVTARGGITRVPTAPRHVLGVMLVQGRLVPVVSLEDAAGDVPSDETTQALPRVVVLHHEDMELGVAVDQIRGVVRHVVTRSAAHSRSANRASYLREEIEWEGRLVCMLDPGALINAMMQGRNG